MAFGSTEILARTKPRVAAGLTAKQRESLNYDILQLIDPARERLGWKVFQSKNYQSLRKDFAFTPVAGVADLSASSALIPESISKGDVRLASSDTTPLIMARSHNELKATTPADVIVWELSTTTNGAALRFRDAAGSITAFVAPIVVTANCIPTVSDLSSYFPQHQNDFIDIIVELFNQRGSIIAPDDDGPAQLSA